MISTLKYLPVLCALLACSVNSIAASGYFKFMNVTIQVADSADAARFITQPDDYTSSFSTFDMQGRFRDKKSHTEAEYLAMAGKQMRTWTAAEQEKIEAAFGELATTIRAKQMKLRLPDTVLFIKSTCMEEFGAGGYTRKNAIIINKDEGVSTSLVAHELFHVLSRHNALLRDKLYDNIGFKPCNRIDVTEAMNGLNITNPDCPVISHYVTVAGEDMVLVLHSKKPYDGGVVFEEDYIDISLLVVTGDASNKKPRIKDGKAVTYKLDEKMELFSIIGSNTPYVLHPEEVCAEHFSALVTGKEVNEPEYLEKMRADMAE
ncbi:MAG TPA: hypothetical protein VIN07_08095 [Flavipsychrobacter sp.]